MLIPNYRVGWIIKDHNGRLLAGTREGGLAAAMHVHLTDVF